MFMFKNLLTNIVLKKIKVQHLFLIGIIQKGPPSGIKNVNSATSKGFIHQIAKIVENMI